MTGVVRAASGQGVILRCAPLCGGSSGGNGIGGRVY